MLVYHTDGVGSVRATTDAAGVVTNTYRTDEFGVPTDTQGPSAQPHRYTGEPRDAESGLVYLRARYYDPSIGRFMGRDRYCGRPSGPLTLNRFVYALDNPVSMVDPSGLKSRLLSAQAYPLSEVEKGPCVGAIAAGLLLVYALLPVDAALAYATAVASVTVPVAELVLVPADIAAAWLTVSGGALIYQGAARSCEDIQLTLNPFEAFQ